MEFPNPLYLSSRMVRVSIPLLLFIAIQYFGRYTEYNYKNNNFQTFYRQEGSLKKNLYSLGEYMRATSTSIDVQPDPREERTTKVFFFFLYLLALALPLSEAIKQIATVGIALSGGYLLYLRQVTVTRDLMFFGALLLAGASLLSIPFAQNPSGALHGAIDIIKPLAIILILRELSLDNRSILRFFALLFFSFIIAVIWGEYNLLVGIKDYLQLKSIGHVNHSAIYTGIIILSAYGVLFSRNLGASEPEKYFIIRLTTVTLLVGFFALVVEGSRGAIIGTLIPLFLTILFTRQYRDRKTRYLLFVIFLVSLATLLSSTYTINKIRQGLFYDSGRFSIWLAAIKAFVDQNILHQLFGMGSKNFNFIDLQHYVPSFPIAHFSHAHNTFITFLLEKGLIGLFGYLLFLLGLLKDLWQFCRERYLRIIAFNVFILNLIVSIVNTTFHDENSLLMGILWGLALQKKR